MAVRIGADALLDAVGDKLAHAARECAESGRVGPIMKQDGGASAAVLDFGDVRREVWVGLVDGGLIGECDCEDGRGQEDLCLHAVATALIAIEGGFDWASAEPSDEETPIPYDERCARAARIMDRDRLITFMAEQGGRDRLFAARLLAEAGMLHEPRPADIRAARGAIGGVIEVTGGRNWDLHQLVVAGEDLVEEVEVLAWRPPTDEQLAVVEEAIRVWDNESGDLHEAGDVYDDEGAEIASALARIHLDLCRRLLPDPLVLADRLAELVGEAEYEAVLDIDAYADVLGPEGVVAYETRLETVRGW